MRPGANGAIKAETLEFDLADLRKDATIIPVVM
jgi:hypothetical protein